MYEDVWLWFFFFLHMVLIIFLDFSYLLISPSLFGLRVVLALTSEAGCKTGTVLVPLHYVNIWYIINKKVVLE